jgi:hypothetical protein
MRIDDLSLAVQQTYVGRPAERKPDLLVERAENGA